MTEGQARIYFEDSYRNGKKPGVAGLYMGSNYMWDNEGKLWECMVWAMGPIWYVKEIKPGEHGYEGHVRAAAYREDTAYQLPYNDITNPRTHWDTVDDSTWKHLRRSH